MTEDKENLYTKLSKNFHEPNRLAIMSALAAIPDGMTFTEIKKECSLTDGNLSRHLKTLEEADAIIVEKSFVGLKPQTKITLSQAGRDSFVEYLNALANVLIRASEALESPAENTGDIPMDGTARA